MLSAALHRYRGVGLLVSHDRELLDDLCGQCLFIDPPDATLRPGGVSQGAEQGQIEQETSRRHDDDAKHAVDRLHRETQRRREAGDQFAAKTKAAKRKKPPANLGTFMSPDWGTQYPKGLRVPRGGPARFRFIFALRTAVFLGVLRQLAWRLHKG